MSRSGLTSSEKNGHDPLLSPVSETILSDGDKNYLVSVDDELLNWNLTNSQLMEYETLHLFGRDPVILDQFIGLGNSRIGILQQGFTNGPQRDMEEYYGSITNYNPPGQIFCSFFADLDKIFVTNVSGGTLDEIPYATFTDRDNTIQITPEAEQSVEGAKKKKRETSGMNDNSQVCKTPGRRDGRKSLTEQSEEKVPTGYLHFAADSFTGTPYRKESPMLRSKNSKSTSSRKKESRKCTTSTKAQMLCPDCRGKFKKSGESKRSEKAPAEPDKMNLNTAPKKPSRAKKPRVKSESRKDDKPIASPRDINPMDRPLPGPSGGSTPQNSPSVRIIRVTQVAAPMPANHMAIDDSESPRA